MFTAKLEDMAYFNFSFKEMALLMAPFGATTVLVFGVPDSPLALDPAGICS
jgi:CBS-domain-containing membrane protein